MTVVAPGERVASAAQGGYYIKLEQAPLALDVSDANGLADCFLHRIPQGTDFLDLDLTDVAGFHKNRRRAGEAHT